MSSTERWLPIFPLNTVLFPNATLPLQIFEDRYKLMMQHCLGTDSKFGVSLIKDGVEVGGPATPHLFGTVAKIVQVNPVPGDRMLISVIGEQRFQIQDITQNQPYMEAQIRLLWDDEKAWIPPAEIEVMRSAVADHIRLMTGLRGGWLKNGRVPSDPAELSYFIAGMLQIGIHEKEMLLEENSVSRRLETEFKLLRREAGPLRERVEHELKSRFGWQ